MFILLGDIAQCFAPKAWSSLTAATADETRTIARQAFCRVGDRLAKGSDHGNWGNFHSLRSLPDLASENTGRIAHTSENPLGRTVQRDPLYGSGPSDPCVAVDQALRFPPSRTGMKTPTARQVLYLQPKSITRRITG